jgi:chromosome segregation ATPase
MSLSLKHAIQSLEGENATVKSKAQTLTLEKSTLDERLRSEVEARRELEAELRQTKSLLQKANQNASDERAKAMAAQDAIDDANTVKQQLSGFAAGALTARRRTRAMQDGDCQHCQRRAQHLAAHREIARGEEPARRSRG